MNRVAVIGAGMWAPRLVAAARRADLEVAACYSRSPEKAERLGAPVAASFEDAVDAAEGVVLATPNDVHADQAVTAAGRGRHVFVEKPIADTLASAVRIRDACVAAGVVLMVGHGFRRLGAARRVGELVAEGRLGRVVLAEATFSLPGKLGPQAWRAHRSRNQGGPLMQLGIHHVDTLLGWLGPARRTTGVMAHVHTDADIDDVGVAAFELQAGGIGVLTGSYVSPHTFAIRLQGTEAVLDYRADLGAVWPDAERVDEVSTVLVGGEPVAFEPRDMLAEELREWALATRGEAVVETGAAEAMAALRVILEAVGQ